MILRPVIAFAVPGFFASSILLGLLAQILFLGRFGSVRVFYPVVSLRLLCPFLGLSFCLWFALAGVYLGGGLSLGCALLLGGWGYE